MADPPFPPITARKPDQRTPQQAPVQRVVAPPSTAKKTLSPAPVDDGGEN